MRRLLRALGVLLLAVPCSAQTARDSAHAKAVKPSADSVSAALAKFCKTKSAVGYVCSLRSTVAHIVAPLQAILATLPKAQG